MDEVEKKLFDAMVNIDHGDATFGIAKLFSIDPNSVIDLAKSMNPFAEDIKTVVAKHLDDLKSYPNADYATGCLAETIGVSKNKVLITNGASEAIALVANAFPIGNFFEPEFSLYKMHLNKIDPKVGKLWRSNPNNPTGVLAEDYQTADVWDEAYYQLSTGMWTRKENGENSIVLGSLTKLYNCPGLRIGYIYCNNEDTINLLKRSIPKWSVNALGLAVIPELLSNTDLIKWNLWISELRGLLVDKLSELGYKTSNSDAPYVLVYNASNLLVPLGKRGIFIRSCKSFGLENDVRIAVPCESQIKSVLRSLEAVSSGVGK